MTDIVPPAVRSRMMSGIRGRDTTPEMVVRRFLHSRGFRYRTHDRALPGRPDIVLPRHRAVVLVHGCFWHAHPGCRFAYQPKSNAEFWSVKLTRNAERDAEVERALAGRGLQVFVVWECQVGVDRLTTLEAELRATSGS